MRNPTDDNRTETEGAPTPATEPQTAQTPDPEPEVEHTLAAGTRVLPHDDPSDHAPSKPHGFAGVKDAFTRHRTTFILLGLGAIAIAAILVTAGIHASNLPPTDVVETDAVDRLEAPDYDAGLYGNADKLALVSLDVVSRTRTETAITSDAAQFGASGYASASVTATYKNSSVSVTKTATLGYAKVGDSWQGIGTEQDARLSYEATSGVDQSRMLESLDAILERADQTLHADDPDDTSYADGLSLVGIYGDTKASVEDEQFDASAQTDVVVLDLTKREGFGEYTCELTVHFAFRAANGVWEIDSVDVSDGAETLSYEPVVGTWTGTFQSQETDGTKCLAASSTPFEVTITSSEDSSTSARLVGTVSGLAHFHEHPKANADSCTGDLAFTDVSFTAVLDAASSSDSGGPATFVATLPEMAGGTVSITLDFGTTSDPTEVVAVVETTYAHPTSFLFVEYEENIGYKDSYVLHQTQ